MCSLKIMIKLYSSLNKLLFLIFADFLFFFQVADFYNSQEQIKNQNNNDTNKKINEEDFY